MICSGDTQFLYRYKTHMLFCVIILYIMNTYLVVQDNVFKKQTTFPKNRKQGTVGTAIVESPPVPLMDISNATDFKEKNSFLTKKQHKNKSEAKTLVGKLHRQNIITRKLDNGDSENIQISNLATHTYSKYKSSTSWLDEYYCEVHCKVATPCEYKDEVDFRVIVMTMNRPESLNKTLAHVGSLKVKDGVRIGVDIWVDRSSRGEIDSKTLLISSAFKSKWRRGRVCIHIREQNANIWGQWIDTWHPKTNTAEIALILEDDIDISPYTYSWLYSVHKEYGSHSDIAGYTLQMEHIYWFAGLGYEMQGPKNDTAFLYGALGTWGFSPHPSSWRDFQKWFHNVKSKSKSKKFKPYVPDIVPTLWYKEEEIRGKEDTMWEMWHIYYTYIQKQYTVYCNLYVKTERTDVFLSLNRRELGLHYTQKEQESLNNLFEIPNKKLLTFWRPGFGVLPKHIKKFAYNGTSIN